MRYFLAAGLLALGWQAAMAQEREDRYVTVDGWALHGYANGIEIGYRWFADEGDCLKIKAEWEATRTTTGKYYDSVEKKPERRRVPRDQAPSTRRPNPEPNPSLPSTPRPGGGQPKEISLGGTSWVGHETASDTSNLQFNFGSDGQVTAYDDTRQVWSGTWRMIGKTAVVIELTSPHEVNYSGQIRGNKLSGKAGRPGTRQWNWSVELK